MTKAEARKFAKQRISAMLPEDREWADGCICDTLSSLEQFKKARSIFVYISAENEVDTHEIIGLSLALEKAVCVPRVKGDTMEAVIISPFTNFVKNKWGIEEPHGGSVCKTDLDLIIVPLVGFDGKNRLGHGKGFYDRFLSKSKAFKLGIAYECQRIEGLETQPHDVPLDMILTEETCG